MTREQALKELNLLFELDDNPKPIEYFVKHQSRFYCLLNKQEEIDYANSLINRYFLTRLMRQINLELNEETYQSFKEILKRVAYMPDSILCVEDGDTAQEILGQLAKDDKTIVFSQFGPTFFPGSLRE